MAMQIELTTKKIKHWGNTILRLLNLLVKTFKFISLGFLWSRFLVTDVSSSTFLDVAEGSTSQWGRKQYMKEMGTSSSVY